MNSHENEKLSPKLADVAKKARVSTATVSRVLNKLAYPVAEETRQRVLTAAREMGYQPNILARSLAAQKTYTLELFMDLSYDARGDSGVGVFLERTLLGIEQVAETSGYRVILDINRSGDAAEDDSVAGSFPISGAIVICPRTGNPKIPFLVGRQIPFIVLGSSEYREYSYVDVDSMAGASKATEYLIELGHRDIVCLGGPSNFRPSLDRMAGFRRAMRAAGFQCAEDKCIFAGDWNWDNGFRMMDRILAEREKRPTAVFACNDMLAMGAIRAIKALGLTVPDDISVIGFDDLPSSELIDPPLSTVHQPFYDVAKIAAQVVIEQIEGNRSSDVPYQDLVIPELMLRSSTTVPIGSN